MFSTKQKREIADKIQKILRGTNHPELPHGEISFLLHVDGYDSESWADIKNNGAFTESQVEGLYNDEIRTKEIVDEHTSRP